MGYRTTAGSVSVAVMLLALPACSGEAQGKGAGGSAGMNAPEGSGGLGGVGGLAGSGGARSLGGSIGASGGAKSQGGSIGSASGGSSGAVDLSHDPGSGTCTDFTPCGGDVLGTWSMESACLETITPGFSECPGAKLNISISGSLTFMADGTYIPRGTTSSRTTLPASCSELCLDSSCTRGADGGCVCEATETINETPLAYSTQENQLIVEPRAGVVQTAYYCRKGELMWMRGYSTANTRYQYDLRHAEGL